MWTFITLDSEKYYKKSWDHSSLLKSCVSSRDKSYEAILPSHPLTYPLLARTANAGKQDGI